MVDKSGIENRLRLMLSNCVESLKSCKLHEVVGQEGFLGGLVFGFLFHEAAWLIG